MTKYGDWFRMSHDDSLSDHVAGVHLGIIDDRARTAFSDGWCWALAYAFEATYGLPPVVLLNPMGFTAHAGVLLPDGRIGDIDGVFTPDEWRQNWEVREAVSMEVSVLSDEKRAVFGWLCGSDEERAVEAAEYFLDPCLKLWGVDAAPLDRSASDGNTR